MGTKETLYTAIANINGQPIGWRGKLLDALDAHIRAVVEEVTRDALAKETELRRAIESNRGLDVEAWLMERGR